MKTLAAAVFAFGFAILAFAGQHAPLPPALMSAKSLYIENNSGQAKLGDRCYDELSKWGRFKIVSTQKKRT